MTGKEYRISQGYKICLVRDFVKKNDELKDSQSHPKWDYFNNVRRLFETAGLDHYLNSDVNMITLIKSSLANMYETEKLTMLKVKVA